MGLNYGNSIILDKALEDVVAVFEDRHQIGDWQRGFVGLEEQQGAPGSNGSKAVLHYRNRSRAMTMVETITDNGLPHHFHGRYEMDGVRNVQRHFFKDLGDGRTEWRSESIFEFDSLLMKVMGRLMPGMFRKTSQRFMDDFKDWIENGISARDKS